MPLRLSNGLGLKVEYGDITGAPNTRVNVVATVCTQTPHVLHSKRCTGALALTLPLSLLLPLTLLLPPPPPPPPPPLQPPPPPLQPLPLLVVQSALVYCMHRHHSLHHESLSPGVNVIAREHCACKARFGDSTGGWFRMDR